MKILVVGGGTMGRGIAGLCAQRGHSTAIYESETSDIVGLDVRLAIAESLARELDPERFRAPGILKRLVARGWTGQKAGRGFYAWDGEVARAVGPEEESQ